MDQEACESLGKILLVGGGKMGEAILAGLVSNELIENARITVAEPGAARRDFLEETYSVRLVADAAEALPADTVILAVKPQVISSVLESLVASGSIDGSLVVSIAAGITCETLEAGLPENCSVVRVMPNTPLLVACGMSVVSAASRTRAGDAALVRELLASMGKAELVDERYQNAACAISGSGPAYFACMVDALARAGVNEGLTRDLAQELALQTMKGTAELIEQTKTHPQILIDNVSSPGGTTIAGLLAMEEAGFVTAVGKGVAAAARRAEELG